MLCAVVADVFARIFADDIFAVSFAIRPRRAHKRTDAARVALLIAQELVVTRTAVLVHIADDRVWYGRKGADRAGGLTLAA